MAIDKSNSKPWVKVTVWILVFGLMFAFMGTGVWILIDQWSYWFGNATSPYEQSYQQPDDWVEPEYTPDEEREAYESQLMVLEQQFADDPSDDVAERLAGMSASYGAWIMNSEGDIDYSRAIALFERALELDTEQFESYVSGMLAEARLAIGE